MDKKVNFGGTRVSVQTVLNHMYPNFYNTNDIQHVVQKFNEVENRIKAVHTKLRVYFGTYIKKKIIVETTWANYLKAAYPNLFKIDTFLNSILRNGFISNPDNCMEFMNEGVERVYKNDLNVIITLRVEAYVKYIICGCISCRSFLLGAPALKYIVSKVVDGTTRGPSISELVKQITTKLKTIHKLWATVRGESPEAKKIMLYLYNAIPHTTVEENTVLCESLEEAFAALCNKNDILRVLKTGNYTNIINDVAVIVSRRTSCFCGLLTISNTCFRHRLCVRCCDCKACVDDLMETESESD
jgi:hypothetical protein